MMEIIVITTPSPRTWTEGPLRDSTRNVESEDDMLYEEERNRRREKRAIYLLRCMSDMMHTMHMPDLQTPCLILTNVSDSLISVPRVVKKQEPGTLLSWPNMLSADPFIGGIVVIDRKVPPFTAYARVPGAPKNSRQRLDCDDRYNRLTRLWHSRPREVLR